MAGHPQNSPRGLFLKGTVTLTSATITTVTVGGSTITANTSGVVLSSGVKISNAAGGQLRANSTCLLLPTRSALPATRQPGGLCFVSNGTGKMLAFHSTGTTWRYLGKTSVLA